MTQLPEETPSPIESPSILVSTKAALGVPREHTAFDAMILMHINSVLSTLAQLAVGPSNGLHVTGESQTWEELIGTDNRLLAAKTYMYLRVKMLFDPPDIGFVITAMKDQIKELEWRLNVDAEPPLVPTEVGEEVSLVLDGGTP